MHEFVAGAWENAPGVIFPIFLQIDIKVLAVRRYSVVQLTRLIHVLEISTAHLNFIPILGEVAEILVSNRLIGFLLLLWFENLSVRQPVGALVRVEIRDHPSPVFAEAGASFQEGGAEAIENALTARFFALQIVAERRPLL